MHARTGMRGYAGKGTVCGLNAQVCCGVWTACWVDVMAQMVAAPMPMLHLKGWNRPRADSHLSRTVTAQ